MKDTGSAQDAEHEVTMLKVISDLDADLNNVVKFHERVDMSLYDLLEQREWEHHPLHEIRPVAKQGLGVLHTDIKPDNIMFVNMKDQPLRVKLIDFGLAKMASQVELGMEIQPCGYRAPEICLGLPFSKAVDVWGVGCVLAFLYLAQNLFSFKCEYQMVFII
ncbi:unnamed protein product [Pleuronectes platessa]|uniref:Protein kinase domain-containing protein n=1 Tax=Pleuronectes platessa TaxID=8262 RepID=A0A9N7VHX8_PLEPL|nr:unnamed protein product [Pleuronectes platessa]